MGIEKWKDPEYIYADIAYKTYSRLRDEGLNHAKICLQMPEVRGLIDMYYRYNEEHGVRFESGIRYTGD